MSVIYKTLKRLKSQESDQGEIGAVPGIVGNREQPRKRFVLPVSICVLGMVMVFSGVGFIYGLGWIADNGSGMQAAGPTVLRKGIYVKPAPQNIAEAASVDLSAIPQNEFVGSPVQPPSPASYQAPEEIAQLDEKASDAVVALEEPSSSAAAAVAALKTAVSGPEQQPLGIAEPVATKNKKTYASFDADAMADTPAKTPPKDVAETPDIQRTDAEKCLKINRLVEKIKTEMALGREGNIESLLKALEDYKGKNSLFVLKLRAYWHIQRGENDMASELLQKVLRKNDEDFEAGVNMAILEIRNHKYRDAHTRLTLLREIYPEENMVNDLLQKLNGHMKNG